MRNVPACEIAIPRRRSGFADLVNLAEVASFGWVSFSTFDTSGVDVQLDPGGIACL